MKKEKCKRCDGKGKVIRYYPYKRVTCPDCLGEGKVERAR